MSGWFPTEERREDDLPPDLSSSEDELDFDPTQETDAPSHTWDWSWCDPASTNPVAYQAPGAGASGISESSKPPSDRQSDKSVGNRCDFGAESNLMELASLASQQPAMDSQVIGVNDQQVSGSAYQATTSDANVQEQAHKHTPEQAALSLCEEFGSAMTLRECEETLELVSSLSAAVRTELQSRPPIPSSEEAGGAVPPSLGFDLLPAVDVTNIRRCPPIPAPAEAGTREPLASVTAMLDNVFTIPLADLGQTDGSLVNLVDMFHGINLENHPNHTVAQVGNQLLIDLGETPLEVSGTQSGPETLRVDPSGLSPEKSKVPSSIGGGGQSREVSMETPAVDDVHVETVEVTDSGVDKVNEVNVADNSSTTANVATEIVSQPVTPSGAAAETIIESPSPPNPILKKKKGKGEVEASGISKGKMRTRHQRSKDLARMRGVAHTLVHTGEGAEVWKQITSRFLKLQFSKPQIFMQIWNLFTEEAGHCINLVKDEQPVRLQTFKTNCEIFIEAIKLYLVDTLVNNETDFVQEAEIFRQQAEEAGKSPRASNLGFNSPRGSSIDSVEKSIRELSQAIQEGSNEVEDSLVEKVTELQKANDKLSSQNLAYQLQIDKLNSQIDKLKQEVAEAKRIRDRDVKRVHNDHEITRQRIDELHNEKVALRDQVKKLVDENRRLDETGTATASVLRKVHKELTIKSNAYEKFSKHLREKLEDKKAEVVSLQLQLSAFQDTDLDALQTAMDLLKEKNQQLKTELLSTKNSLEVAKMQLHSWETSQQTGARPKTSVSMQEQVNRLNQEIETIRKENAKDISQRNQEKLDLQSRVQQLETDSAKAKKDLEVALEGRQQWRAWGEHKERKAQRVVEKCRRTLEERSSAASDTERDRKNLATIQRLQSQLEDNQAVRDDLEQELKYWKRKAKEAEASKRGTPQSSAPTTSTLLEGAVQHFCQEEPWRPPVQRGPRLEAPAPFRPPPRMANAPPPPPNNPEVPVLENRTLPPMISPTISPIFSVGGHVPERQWQRNNIPDPLGRQYTREEIIGLDPGGTVDSSAMRRRRRRLIDSNSQPPPPPYLPQGGNPNRNPPREDGQRNQPPLGRRPENFSSGLVVPELVDHGMSSRHSVSSGSSSQSRQRPNGQGLRRNNSQQENIVPPAQHFSVPPMGVAGQAQPQLQERNQQAPPQFHTDPVTGAIYRLIGSSPRANPFIQTSGNASGNALGNSQRQPNLGLLNPNQAQVAPGPSAQPQQQPQQLWGQQNPPTSQSAWGYQPQQPGSQPFLTGGNAQPLGGQRSSLQTRALGFYQSLPFPWNIPPTKPPVGILDLRKLCRGHTFTGTSVEYKKWSNWFINNVHSTTTEIAHKCDILHECLKKHPSFQATIEGVPCDEFGYAATIADLERQFGQKRNFKKHFLKDVNGWSQITYHNVTLQRLVHQKVVNYISALEQLGENNHLEEASQEFGAIIDKCVPELENKICTWATERGLGLNLETLAKFFLVHQQSVDWKNYRSDPKTTKPVKTTKGKAFVSKKGNTSDNSDSESDSDQEEESVKGDAPKSDRKNSSSKAGNSELTEAIKSLCHAAQSLQVPSKKGWRQSRSPNKGNGRGRQDRSRTPSMSRFNPSPNRTPRSDGGTWQKRTPRCSLCPKPDFNHWTRDCAKLLGVSYEKRVQLANENEICKKCVIPGHKESACYVHKECGTCGSDKHHALFHNPGAEAIKETKDSKSKDSKDSNMRKGKANLAFADNPNSRPDDTIVELPGRVVNVSLYRRVHKAVEEDIVQNEEQPFEDVFSLRILAVKLVGPTGKEEVVNALLDDGSNRTLIDANLAKRLELDHSTPGKLNLEGVAGAKCLNNNSSIVKFGIQSVDGTTKDQIRAATLNNPVGKVYPYHWNTYKHQWPHIEHIDFPEKLGDHCKILIGDDYNDLLASQEEIIPTDIPRPYPIARRTALGWTCTGILTPTNQHPDEDYERRVGMQRYVRSFKLLKTHTLDDKQVGNNPPVISFPKVKARQRYSSLAKQKRQNGHLTCQVHPRDLAFVNSNAKELDAFRLKTFEFEQFPGDDDDVTTRSQQDEEAIRLMRSTRQKVGNQYQIGVLWKPGEPNFDNNFDLAYKRQISLENSRHFKDPKLKEGFLNHIKDWLEKGYFEKVDGKDHKSKNINYVPVFAVHRQDKTTTKIRPVLDGAAKYHGKCLNDAVYQGPNLINRLPSVLTRFRKHKYAIGGDVAEMFLQVLTKETDKQYHRILFREDSKDPLQILQPKVHVFGNAGSPCIAIFTIKEHARENASRYKEAAEAVIHSSIVDDIMDSVQTEEEAIKLFKDLKQLFQECGMNIRKFISNSQYVLSQLPETDRAKNIDITLGNLQTAEVTYPVVKALGMIWLSEPDVFTFSYDKPDLVKDKWTKREVLRTLHQVFDPLGLLAPFLLQAKIFLKSLWDRKLDWDDDIGPEATQAWLDWLEHFKLFPKVQVPRCLMPTLEGVEVHIFADASQYAYGTVMYVVVGAEGDKVSNIVSANTRIVSKQGVTIPRLELCAALLATQLATEFKNALGDCPRYFWTDSSNVNYWLKNTERQRKLFVTNRVVKVLTVSTPQEWRWVPGLENPADLASRGETLGQLDQFWFNGPEFILKPPSKWPEQPKSYSLSPEAELEFKIEHPPSKVMTLFAFLELAKKRKQWTWLHKEKKWYLANVRHGSFDKGLFDAAKHSSYLKALRAARLLVAWIQWSKTNPKRFSHNDNDYQPLMKQNPSHNVAWFRQKPEVRDEAKLFLLRQAQVHSFSDVYEHLTKGNNVPVGHMLARLKPFLDKDGIMRVKGRLAFSKHLPYDEKHPIILDASSPLAKLLIKHFHECILMHIGGVNHLLSLLSKNYYILGARREIKNYLKGCVSCQKADPHPNRQVMAPLPDFRVPKEKLTAPFLSTGIDCAGPFRCASRKVWVVVFTCCEYRAVHFELISSMSTEAFLMAFQRFISIRGLPKSVISDNGTNFVGASNVLKDLIRKVDCDTIKSKFSEVDWHFTTPHCPHSGGVFERMVKSMKQALHKIIGGSLNPSIEFFMTALAEAADVINSRPLTVVDTDVNDITPITPNHFLRMWAMPKLEVCPSVWFDKTYSKLGRVLSDLKRQFALEVVQKLHAYPKDWRRELEDFKVGDVVVLIEANHVGSWPLARIIKTYPGPDGHVRHVDLDVVTKAWDETLPQRDESKIRWNTRKCPQACRIAKKILKRDVRRIVRLNVLPNDDTNSNKSKHFTANYAFKVFISRTALLKPEHPIECSCNYYKGFQTLDFPKSEPFIRTHGARNWPRQLENPYKENSKSNVNFVMRKYLVSFNSSSKQTTKSVTLTKHKTSSSLTLPKILVNGHPVSRQQLRWKSGTQKHLS